MTVTVLPSRLSSTHLLARAAPAEGRGRRPCSPRRGRRCSSARRRRARRRCRRVRRAPRGRRRGCRRAPPACRAGPPRPARRRVAARPRTPRNGRRTRPSRLELGEHALDRRDRDREADPDAARRAVAGGDLRVDADHAAGGVEQRAARVAGVERRVGLDDVLDREAARRGDAPLQRRHDAGGERALEPNGLPIATVGSPTRTAEESPSSSGCRSGPSGSPQHARSVSASLPITRAVTVRWSENETRTSVEAGDHVRVGEDVALVVEHEARAGGDVLLLAREDLERRLGRLHRAGADEHDAGGGPAVDVARGQAAAPRAGAGAAEVSGACSTIVVVCRRRRRRRRAGRRRSRRRR